LTLLLFHEIPIIDKKIVYLDRTKAQMTT